MQVFYIALTILIFNIIIPSSIFWIPYAMDYLHQTYETMVFTIAFLMAAGTFIGYNETR